MVSRSEVISIFSNIEEKISELHQCSAKDFLKLNNHLRDYHKKTSLISKNASIIFKMLGGEKGTQLLTNLEEILAKITYCRSRDEEMSVEYILTLEKILAKTILLTLSLKNFKQDLTTIKFLVSNYKLISNYENFDSDWNNSVNVWEALARDIRSSFPELGSRLEEFKNQVYTLINQAKSTRDKSSIRYDNLTKDIEACINLVSQKHQESSLQIPLLKQKIENSSQSIANIITHLQYQDIIKQKIDHIKQSHSQIIDNLQHQEQSEQNSSEDSGLIKYYQKIGDVAGLQTAQLLLVNNEYQVAIEVIIKSFQQIGDDLTSISSLSQIISFESNTSEFTLIRHIKDKLGKGIILLDGENLSEHVINDHEIGTREHDLLLEIKKISDPFEKVTKHDLFSTSGDGAVPEPSDSHPRVLKQIISLVSEIKAKTEKFSDSIREIIDLSIQLRSQEGDINWEGQFERDQISIMVDLSKILNNLDDENITLDNYLAENKLLYEEITDNIKYAINNIDYYDFFEKVIEDVITDLNDINYKLKPRDNEGSKSKLIDNLEDLKSHYTMESERIIHNRVEEGQDENPAAIELPAQDDDDEVELF
ncbi:MAG: hypothetical protein GY790_10500 [Bacteroidetes bacterium]|nr:hypothetical protein [Bacteroidota bacterium]